MVHMLLLFPMSGDAPSYTREQVLEFGVVSLTILCYKATNTFRNLDFKAMCSQHPPPSSTCSHTMVHRISYMNYAHFFLHFPMISTGELAPLPVV